MKWSQFKQYVVSILGISLPSSLEPVSYHLSQVVISLFFIHLGSVALGARVYSFNLSEANFIWYYSVALSTQILAAHMAGARLFNRLQRQVLHSVFIAAGGSLAICVFVFVFSGPGLRLFTTDVAIIKEAAFLIGMGIVYGPLCAVNTVISYALRAAGDAKYTAFMGLVVMWVIGIPVSYILGIAFHFAAAGVFAGMIADELLRAGLHYRRWRQKYWMSKGVNAVEAVTVAP